MASRLNLHEELCVVLGSRNAYFQPPATVQMEYDCFVYKLVGADVMRANNGTYHLTPKYEVTAIFRNPDRDFLAPMLARFQYCRLERAYTADNLYHQVFTIYY